MEQPMLLTPEQAAKQLGIGRAKMFELLGTGAVKSVKIGRCRRVAIEDLGAYVQQLRQQEATAA